MGWNFEKGYGLLKVFGRSIGGTVMIVMSEEWNRVKMRVAVCEQDSVCCSRIEGWLSSVAERENVELEVEAYGSVDDLQRRLDQDEWYDAIFIDIRSSEESGIILGKKVRQFWDRESVSLIFFSDDESCCTELFGLQPLNFHLKPLREEYIRTDMYKITRRMEKGKRVLKYTEEGKLKGIDLSHVILIKAIDKKLLVKTDEKEIFLRDSLNHMEKQFARFNFCRCHRSYLVNLYWVDDYRKRTFGLRDGASIPVGDKYVPVVREALAQYDYWEWV